MTYLNSDCIEQVSSSAFQTQKPYPWAHMQDTLTGEGWERLRADLPDMSQFNRMVGVKRSHGQAPHNRGILHYRDGMDVAESWKDFIAELHGKAYDAFLRHMLGLEPDQQIILTMEWYYAWQGCSVSPHCDARRAFEAFVKRHRAERIGPERGVRRIYVALLEAQLEELDNAKHKRHRADAEDDDWCVAFHAVLRILSTLLAKRPTTSPSTACDPYQTRSNSVTFSANIAGMSASA